MQLRPNFYTRNTGCVQSAVIFLMAILFGVSCKSPTLEQSQEEGTVIQICPPFQTPLERNLWLSLPSHYVAKKLFSNYMNCQAKELKLSAQEMVDIHPFTLPNVQSAPQELIKFADFVKEKTEIVTSPQLDFSFFSFASGGTLGVFTIHFNGHLKFDPSLSQGNLARGGTQDIHLIGDFRFEDTWDFDPKDEGERMTSTGGDDTAESRTRLASKFMSGRGFDVTSEVASGTMGFTILRFKDNIVIGQKFFSLVGVNPTSDRPPRFSPLGLKLVEIVRSSKNKEFNFFEVIKILKETCEKTEELEVKNLCPGGDDFQ